MNIKFDDTINCPNCGAIIHGSICEYCGTVFQSNINEFQGRDALIISMDENDNLVITSTKINSIEQTREYDTYCTLDNIVYKPLLSNFSIDINATVLDSIGMCDNLKKLKKILNEKL